MFFFINKDIYCACCAPPPVVKLIGELCWIDKLGSYFASNFGTHDPPLFEPPPLLVDKAAAAAKSNRCISTSYFCTAERSYFGSYNEGEMFGALFFNICVLTGQKIVFDCFYYEKEPTKMFLSILFFSFFLIFKRNSSLFLYLFFFSFSFSRQYCTTFYRFLQLLRYCNPYCNCFITRGYSE